MGWTGFNGGDPYAASIDASLAVLNTHEEEALAVFEEMLDAGIRFVITSFSYIKVLSQTIRPTQKAYNILLDVFAISGMIEQAQVVFKSMQRDRCTPDLCSYTTMLSAYVNASDMGGAEKFFRRIKHDGFEPNVVTYGTLIKGYAKVNNIEKMMEKYEEMQLCGLIANTTIFTTIMDAHGRNHGFDSAVIWFNEMGSNGIPPDQKAKNILLSLAKSAEEKEEAYLLVGCTNGHKANVIPNTDNYDSDVDCNDDSQQTIQFTPEDELILANG